MADRTSKSPAINPDDKKILLQGAMYVWNPWLQVLSNCEGKHYAYKICE